MVLWFFINFVKLKIKAFTLSFENKTTKGGTCEQQYCLFQQWFPPSKIKERKKFVQNAICYLIETLLQKRFELETPALFCNMSTAISAISRGAAHFTKYHCSTFFLESKSINTFYSQFIYCTCYLTRENTPAYKMNGNHHFFP